MERCYFASPLVVRGGNGVGFRSQQKSPPRPCSHETILLSALLLIISSAEKLFFFFCLVLYSFCKFFSYRSVFFLFFFSREEVEVMVGWRDIQYARGEEEETDRSYYRTSQLNMSGRITCEKIRVCSQSDAPDEVSVRNIYF